MDIEEKLQKVQKAEAEEIQRENLRWFQNQRIRLQQDARKCNVAVPIVEAVNRVLFENADPKEEVSNLLLRERKQEHTNLEWN